MNPAIRATRKHPACFVLLIDQSYSMSGAMSGGRGASKADAVADSTNQLLGRLVQRCFVDEEARHFFDIALIGYSDGVGPLLQGPLTGQFLVSPAQMAEAVSRVHTDASGTSWPVWIEPRADGETRMCAAFDLARDLVGSWVARHQDSPAPVVINISDGEATDGGIDDLAQRAAALRQLRTDGGELQLFNIAIASQSETPQYYPDSPNGLPDKYTKALFDISSVLTPRLVEYANHFATAAGRPPLRAGARAFVFNADLAAMVEALSIGSNDPNFGNPR
ncbi:vWA domain-containing protein [Actinacidiphila yeochonensis]|uniref:vWA domain-containing protein n=1 Tax=Actinacidiphila yeochonensis TaxID=89050 RepID=UPI000562C96F|nr:vWA domain-containing protein [Actinacidiphila yeochonensis]